MPTHKKEIRFTEQLGNSGSKQSGTEIWPVCHTRKLASLFHITKQKILSKNST